FWRRLMSFVALRKRVDAPVGNWMPRVRRGLRSPGKPLNAETRALLETSFGHEFSKPRVHADTKAAASADRLEAQAYTVGSDIVFGTGRYSSDSPRGIGLL